MGDEIHSEEHSALGLFLAAGLLMTAACDQTTPADDWTFESKDAQIDSRSDSQYVDVDASPDDAEDTEPDVPVCADADPPMFEEPPEDCQLFGPEYCMDGATYRCDPEGSDEKVADDCCDVRYRDVAVDWIESAGTRYRTVDDESACFTGRRHVEMDSHVTLDVTNVGTAPANVYCAAHNCVTEDFAECSPTSTMSDGWSSTARQREIGGPTLQSIADAGEETFYPLDLPPTRQCPTYVTVVCMAFPPDSTPTTTTFETFFESPVFTDCTVTEKLEKSSMDLTGPVTAACEQPDAQVTSYLMMEQPSR